MRIPRLRTITGLISGPAIIAAGLATFALAIASLIEASINKRRMRCDESC